MPNPTIDEQIRRAEVLIEALPYIKRFSGHTLVIKLGGAAGAGSDIDSVLQDVVLLRFVGMRPVLVHGGGHEISAWQERMGLEPRFVNGLRVTDAPTMEIAKMVLTGKVGPDIVSRIHRLGAGAIGLSGEDGPTLLVRPREAEAGAELGYVGEVDQVNGEPISAILDQGTDSCGRLDRSRLRRAGLQRQRRHRGGRACHCSARKQADTAHRR
jgi:acetylglutamate kinase